MHIWGVSCYNDKRFKKPSSLALRNGCLSGGGNTVCGGNLGASILLGAFSTLFGLFSRNVDQDCKNDSLAKDAKCEKSAEN